MKKYQHTIQIAIAINARAIDDHGAPVAAWVGRVIYLWLWLPGWIYGLRPARAGSAGNSEGGRHRRKWRGLRGHRRSWRWLPAQAALEAWLAWTVGRLLLAEVGQRVGI